ncbi:hypothetical protein O3P69_007903 [Scylla paramamosain]|uniref:Uncharacterized protein n=1 Tax=Scylla paramamosain TaxID=85552 RepID=A0AAW0T034_SCYPA
MKDARLGEEGEKEKNVSNVECGTGVLPCRQRPSLPPCLPDSPAGISTRRTHNVLKKKAVSLRAACQVAAAAAARIPGVAAVH